MMKKLMIFLLSCGLTGCTATPETAQSVTEPEVLTVHNDGRMEYRERIMPEDDVIIYADGRGGERAAVRVYVPYMNDYFRDSIRVERKDQQNTVTN